MSFRSKLGASKVYTKPKQLPENVAFEVLSMYQKSNPNRADSTVNITLLKHSSGVNLEVYLPAKFNSLDKDDVKALNDEISKGTKWYLRSRGFVGNSIVLDLMDNAEVTSSEIPIFNSQNHHIKPDSMKSFSDSSDSDVSPKKFKKETD